jgi:hypothetical protein
MISIQTHRPEQGGALVVVMILLFVMSVFLLSIHDYTDGVGAETGRTVEALRANAAAGAAADVVIGRLIQWTNNNSSYTPSIQDCATVGVPGNATFPAITGAITFPAGSKLSDYTVSTPIVYPVLPDDTVVTNSSASNYLTNVSQRINVSDNSPTSVAKYYFTHTASTSANSVMCRSITYQITVTVTPKVKSLKSAQPVTLVRYLRIDKLSPFGWCTYRNGSVTYANSNTYNGPLYIAENVTFYSPTTFTNDVLYGVSSVNYGANFTSGGYASQVMQTSLLSLIPNLASAMAVNSSGVRLAGYETNTTAGAASNSTTSDPADMFSTREVIEPPTNPSNDVTPTAFQNARIYNQADIRIQVSVARSGTTAVVTKNVVNVNGSVVSAASNPWVTQVLAAVNVNTTPAGSAGAFIDHERSTTQSVQSTDINVGALATVMNANPTVFPTGIIYVWDSSTASGGVTPLTGVRVWNAGVLPNVGLELGTDDPIYMRGDFNTGTTLPANATVNTYPSVMPYSSNGMAVNDNPTTESQREVSGYTIKPAGLFGDSITELSNSWNDYNSTSTEYASNTTYNLVEAWTTMSSNELRPDDTYLDAASRANPLWLEWWGGARRTMSGEEMAVWHSKYGDNTTESYNGGWQGDISFDAKATALNLNWGATLFVRDRVARQ